MGIFFGGEEEEEDDVVCFATPAKGRTLVLHLQECNFHSSCHRWLDCLILENANRHKTNKPFSAGGGGGGGGGGAGARLAWCGGRVKTHIVRTSVGMKKK